MFDYLQVYHKSVGISYILAQIILTKVYVPKDIILFKKEKP